MLEPFGGKFLLRADKRGDELAGTYPYDFVVMLEFPDTDAARGRYGS